jgi:hypothetical protein
MKTILLILALSGSLSAEVGVSLYTNGISKGAADARYVLRNPYYDGSQSVTVASATVNGLVGINYASALDTAFESIRFGRTDSALRYHSIFGQHGTVEANNQLQFRLHPGGGAGTEPQTTVMTLAGSGAVTIPGSSFSVGGGTLVVKEGKVGVGTASPAHGIDLVNAATYALRISNSETNTSAKTAKVVGRHYLNSEKDILMMMGDGSSTANPIYIGGGSSAQNAATSIQLYTAANYNTTTGTERFRIDSAGNVGIGTTAPTSKVSVSSSTASTAFMGLNGAATKAEILAFDPVKAGEMFFCTDCVASTVCISTGTAVADFADIGDRTVACN